MNGAFRFFCCLLLMMKAFCVQAQDNNYLYKDSSLMAAEEQVVVDSTAAVTEVDDEEADAEDAVVYVQDSALYANELELHADSVLKLLRQEKLLTSRTLSKQLQDIKNANVQQEESKPATGSWLVDLLSAQVTSVILWGIAIFIVLFVLVKLFLTSGVFRGSGKKAPIILVQEQQDEPPSSAQEFFARIKAAKLNGDYRTATRWLFLQALMTLREKDAINFAVDKTNRQYLAELEQTNYRSSFATLTRQYEYVWYGNFQLTASQFEQLENEFAAFNKMVNQK